MPHTPLLEVFAGFDFCCRLYLSWFDGVFESEPFCLLWNENKLDQYRI